MAKPHFFALADNATEKIGTQKVRGQAAQVLAELQRDTTPRLASDIDEAIAKSDNPFKTRQDTLRVTLYYLIIFSNRGWVVKTKPVVEAPAEVVDEADDAEVETEDEVEVVEA